MSTPESPKGIEPPVVPSRRQWMWYAAAAVGGLTGVLSPFGWIWGETRLGSLDHVLEVSVFVLCSAPFFIGTIAAIARPNRPGVTSLLLSGVCLLVSAPLLGYGIICYIYIVPVHLVVSPLVALLVAWIRRRLANRPGISTPLTCLLLFLPAAAPAVGRRTLPRQRPVVTISDSVVVDAPREVVWASIDRLEMRFDLPAPWIVRLALPRPIGIRGGGAQVGAERRVLFHNGVVLATVTRSERPRRFDFALRIERSGREFFDHSTVLLDSTFLLEPTADGRTRVTHATRYRPLAYPRWYFEPGERYLARQVQRYMLEAYGRQVFGAPTREPVAAR